VLGWYFESVSGFENLMKTKEFPTATKVKSAFAHHRIVIALHSPTEVFEPD
jgi:hypothetical protein